MNTHHPIRDAIDESLCGIHFSTQDMHSVLRSVRRPSKNHSRGVPMRRRRLDLAFAAAMLLLVVAPFSLFALRAQRVRPVTVAASGGATPVPNILPLATPAPTQIAVSPTVAPPEQTARPLAPISQDEALRIARQCFETHCDTDVSAFDEYALQTTLIQPSEGCAQYIVRMDSIYGNGCSFTVVVSAENGEVIQYSSPSMATQPMSSTP